MPYLDMGPGESLYFEHQPPSRPGAPSFVFVNDVIGDLSDWEAEIAPSLRSEGFGTLVFNLRGQAGSETPSDAALTPARMVSDLRLLLRSVLAEAPILVGASMGGLFAAQAHIDGARASGLVLVNTLREVGPRLAWVAEATPLMFAAGGAALYWDAMLPMLAGPDFVARAQAQGVGPYAPLAPTDARLNLLRHAREADWRLQYEALRLPTLVITGLHDRIFLDRDVVNKSIERLPDARAEVWDNAGHLAVREQPDQMALSLARFAAEIEAGAARA